MLSAAPPRAYLLLTVAQLALGLAGIFASLALTGTGAIEVTFLRLAIVVPIIFVIAAAKRRLVRLDRADTLRLLAAGVSLGLHFVFWIASLCYISVALSTLLVCSTPFWLALFDAVVARRPITLGYKIGIPLAAVSVIFLVGVAPSAHTVSGSQPVLGSLLAIGAALLVGTYLYLLRPLQTRHRTLTVVTYTYSGALLTLIPLTMYAHQPLPTSTLSWTGILLIAGFTHLLGHTALSASLRFFSATLIAFICLLEPVIAAVGAAVFLHQALRPQIIFGGLTLLAAIACILRDEADAPEIPLASAGEL